MTISDLIMIIAVLAAPFCAVFAQDRIQINREKRSQKLWIFKTLMATRRAPTNITHVQALNMIDLEFSDRKRKESEVKQIWREYLNHLGELRQEQDNRSDNDALHRWLEKNDEYLAKLLVAMGKCFGHRFDVVYIKQGIYEPRKYAEDEILGREMRDRVLKVLRGDIPLPITAKIVAADSDSANFTVEYRQRIKDLLEGKSPLCVEIKSSSAKLHE